jgi:hypothetical protein
MLLAPTYQQAGVDAYPIAFTNWLKGTKAETRPYPLDDPAVTAISLLLRVLGCSQIAYCANGAPPNIPGVLVQAQPIFGLFDAALVHTPGQVLRCEAGWYIARLDSGSLFESSSRQFLSPETALQVYHFPADVVFALYADKPIESFPAQIDITRLTTATTYSMRAALASKRLSVRSPEDVYDVDVGADTLAPMLTDWKLWSEMLRGEAPRALSALCLGRALTNLATFTRTAPRTLEDLARRAPPWIYARERGGFLATRRPASRLRCVQESGPTQIHLDPDGSTVVLQYGLPRTGTPPTLRTVFNNLVSLPLDMGFLHRFLRGRPGTRPRVWLEFDMPLPGYDVRCLTPLAARSLLTEVPRGEIVVGYTTNTELWQEVIAYASGVFRCTFTLLDLTPGRLGIQGTPQVQALFESVLTRR